MTGPGENNPQIAGISRGQPSSRQGQ